MQVTRLSADNFVFTYGELTSVIFFRLNFALTKAINGMSNALIDDHLHKFIVLVNGSMQF
jgi:hypothetical protein